MLVVIVILFYLYFSFYFTNVLEFCTRTDYPGRLSPLILLPVAQPQVDQARRIYQLFYWALKPNSSTPWTWKSGAIITITYLGHLFSLLSHCCNERGKAPSFHDQGHSPWSIRVSYAYCFFNFALSISKGTWIRFTF